MRLSGQVCGDVGNLQMIQIGVYRTLRMTGQPISWTAAQPDGSFHLLAPPGSWFLHASCAALESGLFASDGACGSYGGPYGAGLPVPVCHYPVPGLNIHVSPMWRDHSRLELHRQMGLNREQQKTVRTVISALAEGLADPTLPRLESQTGYVRSRLAALFHRSTGYTMGEYRKRLRLELAKALLIETDTDVLAAALEVGYSTPAALGRLFKEYIGLSPGEFRDKARALRQSHRAVPTSPEALARVRIRTLGSLLPEGATISGTVRYDGGKLGAVVYVLAFSRPDPSLLPVAWTALAKPGPFTLHGVPPGSYHLLACYSSRRMHRSGDYGGAIAWAAAPERLVVGAHDHVADVALNLTDGWKW